MPGTRPGITSSTGLNGEARSGGLAAQMLAYRDLLRAEGLAQNRHASIRIGLAAHEDVECGIAVFRPCMDGDVALGQHRHAGHAAVRLKVMQMDMQQRGAGHFYATPQRRLDVVDVVKLAGLVEVDDEVRARAPHSVPHHEMIVTLLGLRRGRCDHNFFLSGGTWSPQALPRSQEGVLLHSALSNQRSTERPANRLTE